jgi:hypothetical protein
MLDRMAATERKRVGMKSASLGRVKARRRVGRYRSRRRRMRVLMSRKKSRSRRKMERPMWESEGKRWGVRARVRDIPAVDIL